MLRAIRRWREDRRLSGLQVAESAWLEAEALWPGAARYRGVRRDRLRETALRFLMRKRFEAGDELKIEDRMRLTVALMAAAPVMELGLDWYAGWYAVILYPGGFVPGQEYEDEFGVVHVDRHALSGEAWPQGPVILSWDDVLAANADDGYNVVVHEMSHKLDMLNDGANGFPPLHAGMQPAAWEAAFRGAWEDLSRRAQRDEPLPLDPYALENPGEFFAVACESFFESPERLAEAWPAVYDQLAAFFRQDPRNEI
jgi:MtfA peptidase